MFFSFHHSSMEGIINDTWLYFINPMMHGHNSYIHIRTMDVNNCMNDTLQIFGGTLRVN